MHTPRFLTVLVASAGALSGCNQNNYEESTRIANEIRGLYGMIMKQQGSPNGVYYMSPDGENMITISPTQDGGNSAIVHTNNGIMTDRDCNGFVDGCVGDNGELSTDSIQLQRAFLGRLMKIAWGANITTPENPTPQ